MSYEFDSFRSGCRLWILSGLLVAGGSALAQDKAPAVPDAQVEANVLKALAGAPQLSDQNITSTTVYGSVTLSGVVRDEPTRVLAETLVSRTAGVAKVIDELTLGNADASNSSSPAPQDAAQTGTNPNLQSDGTIASPEQQTPQAQYPNHAPDPDKYVPPPISQSPPANNQQSQSGPPNAAQQPPYGAPYGGASPRQPYAPPPSPGGTAPYGAQQAGLPVLVPSGSMVRIRINQGLDSRHSQPGTTFDGVVVNDVIADGAIAIPRGATVEGKVAEVHQSGQLEGRGEVSLQLTSVILGGRQYPIVSDQWSISGGNKTAQTVGNTVGLGAVGALIGAVAGGGAGAAIGAGVGGAAGLGASAASGRSQAFIPPEAILTFHLAQPAQLATVSQAEMDRLAYGVPSGGQRLQRRPPPPPPYYYGPGYYPYPRAYYYPY
jgi:BON domain